MASVYRCTCGKAYNLEEGKKYKCKNCGAVMELAAQAPVASATPASAASKRPAPTTSASKPPIRPSQRAAAASAAGSAARASQRSRGTGEGKAPAPKKSATGLYIGIGVAAAVLLGAIFLFMDGEGEKKAQEAIKAAQAKKAEEENVAAAEAAAKAAKMKEKKKLTKAEFEDLAAQIKRGDEAKDMKALQAVLQKIKDENIDFDRTPLFKAILRIDPQDPQVTGALGMFERNKLNFDEMDARYKRAEKAKDKKALYDTLRWVFENNLNSTTNFGIDYILIYKAILRIDPDDYEARVAALKAKDPRKAPYTGPAQEYKGKMLHPDEFMAAKEIEWKLHKETGIPFLPTEGGGSKAAAQ